MSAVGFRIFWLCLLAGGARVAGAAPASPASPTGLPIPDVTGSILRVGGALTFVLAVFFGGIWLVRNWERFVRLRRAPAKLNVLEVKALGHRHALYVIGYEEDRLLVALSPEGVSLLCHLPPDTSEPAAEPTSSPDGRCPGRVGSPAERRPRFRAPWLAVVLGLALGGAGMAAPTNTSAFALSPTLVSPAFTTPYVLAPTNGLALAPAPASNNKPFRLQLGVEGLGQPQEVDVGIKVLAAITLLSLAPSIILLMTSFTRIVIVLGFVRTALGLPGTPANQIIIGLSLFLTAFIMAPVWDNINREAVQPYSSQLISGPEALERAAAPLSRFMLKQTRPKDVELFVALANLKPTPPEQLPLKVVVPSFITSELRTAFQMGFLLFIPFILIDLVVATVLMSLGMLMMPPMTVSLPLKILLFVLVDGWDLIVRSLVQSFGG